MADSEVDSVPAGRPSLRRARDNFAGGVAGAAGGAVERQHAHLADLLEDAGVPAVETLGAQVVHRLWHAWTVGPSRLWPLVDAIHHDAGAELEQRVAFALRALFFEFSNLLAHGRMLLLEMHEGGIEREQVALDVEQFLGRLRDSGARCVEIADFQCRLRQGDGPAEGRHPSADGGEVHSRSPDGDPGIVAERAGAGPVEAPPAAEVPVVVEEELSPAASIRFHATRAAAEAYSDARIARARGELGGSPPTLQIRSRWPVRVERQGDTMRIFVDMPQPAPPDSDRSAPDPGEAP